MKLYSVSGVKSFEPTRPETTPRFGKSDPKWVASIGREVNSTMECSESFYKAMVAFCRQHAKMQGENERFWLDEAQTWTERLKAKNAFWHQFADKPELPAVYRGASPSDHR
jgi:hypothetical protein